MPVTVALHALTVCVTGLQLVMMSFSLSIQECGFSGSVLQA